MPSSSEIGDPDASTAEINPQDAVHADYCSAGGSLLTKSLIFSTWCR